MQNKEWEERFEEVYSNRIVAGYINYSDVKSFIQKELEQAKEEERQRSIKIVEGKKFPSICSAHQIEDPTCTICNSTLNSMRNLTLDDIIKELN